MAQDTHTIVRTAAEQARTAASVLGTKSSSERNTMLIKLGEALLKSADEIISANQKDIAQAQADGVRSNLIDRLLLDENRLQGCVDALGELAAQSDPLGEVVAGKTLESGIEMVQVRVPLGVCAMIYEARPNVTIDAAGIGIKTGNAMLLRGGALANNTNEALGRVMRQSLKDNGFPEDALAIIDASTRETSTELMNLVGLVDVLIPRGGAGLIAAVVNNSKVPVIETGSGNCHVYVHKDADLAMATNVTHNAKTHRTSVCNSAESLLIDRAILREALDTVARDLADSGVELHADEESGAVLSELGIAYIPATEDDFAEEYLDMKMSVKVVTDVDEAIAHISTYGTHHSDAIITDNIEASHLFTSRVDSAAVYVNASTRFTDGGMFGLGAEIGISTQKLHARGPMGLAAMTSTKFILRGQGQVRA